MNPPIVYAVGIGPGSPELLTPQARQVLESCTVVAGYKLYLDLIAPLVAGKKLIAGAMRGELDRCRRALDAALEGERVAVIGSGDAGIYGMAGLLYELTELDHYRHIAIEVAPGITAAVAAAALAGAPLMNDFAVLSLSDLMTPRDISSLNSFASVWCLIQNILLAATAEHLACSLRIPIRDEESYVLQCVHAPEGYRMPCYLAVGYAAPDAKIIRQTELSVAERIHAESW